MEIGVKTEFTVLSTNKPGELAKLAKAMGKAKVNLEAITLNDGVHHGVVKLVVSDAKAARAVLKKSGFGFIEQQVIAVGLPNKPGALADAAGKLGRAKINIDYIYGSTCGCAEEGCDCGCECTLIVAVSDHSAAKKALG